MALLLFGNCMTSFLCLLMFCLKLLKATFRHYDIADLIEERSVPIVHPALHSSLLHPGESEAIQLAQQLNLPLLIEETAGRTVAQSLGIHISGIAGQIIKAFRLGLITRNDALTMLAELLHAGRINRKIYNALMVVIA
ncbi:MAG: hypothetical protein NT075_27950 [Chloroflexi bacterium]|nr:hypothetical protein [Chloroflexota bacterium]